MRNLVNKPKAVIFDMDGVIVDSMPYHFLAWYEALMPYGVRVTCFDIYSKEGERWDKSLKDLLKKKGITPAGELLRKIFTERQKIFRRYFKRLIFPGTKTFLECLKARGYLLGLVSGSPVEEINHILPPGIKALFDCIIGGDNVKKGKPHPEPYLKAASRLGALPRQCVVIENAPYGINSAKRAGMYCVAVSTSLPKEYLKEADAVVEGLEDIPWIIEKTCNIRSRSVRS